MSYNKIAELLGNEGPSLLDHTCKAIKKEMLHQPGPNFIANTVTHSARNNQTLRSIASLFASGRLCGTGYLSILPVDQGIEHSAGASFSVNPIYFAPEMIIKLALEAGCNAVVSSTALLASVSREYAHRIPFIAKLNHNELLSYPNAYRQNMYASVKQAWDLGALAVGATVYFGSADSRRQLGEVAEAFEAAHHLGMATVLWCYLRNDHFSIAGTDYHTAADLTGQANYLGASIQADIIKQKLPENNGGYRILNNNGLPFGKYDLRMYTDLCSNHPIDLCRYQLLNCFMGRIGMISSGGASYGEADLRAVIRTAVINKRAGGMGVIAGRKAFQRPLKDGIALLNAIQDVYLEKQIEIA
ncbi:class I fructose-bisphosphate aldolase [Pedobacter sp. Du54]|uniref:class I fructose-bisphosphate aldolase n=1 Tax=Pedobacter anseongensis TaxID=3133439 RepID=UPI0030B75CE4